MPGALLLALLLSPNVRPGSRAATPQEVPAPRRAHVLLAAPPTGGEATVSPGEIEAERDRAIARIRTVLGERAEAGTQSAVRYRVYPSAAAKAAATGDGRWAHLEEGAGILHAVVNENIRGDRLGLDWALLFSQALGSPAVPLLERGIAASNAPEWGGRGVHYWTARLHRAGLVPPLTELLSSPWAEQASPLVVTPVAGVLVEFLLVRWSRTGFLDRYATWMPNAGEVEGLEAGWEYHLDRVLAAHGAAIERELEGAAAERNRGLPRLLGFNYASEGYGRYEGYLSDRSNASIARMARLGASGIAVLPYAFMPSAERPAALRPPTRVGSETDEAVVQAILAAKREGLTVLLKPHIWVRGSWPGEIAFRSRREWARFFEGYERWIVHYAILAEMYGVPPPSRSASGSRRPRGAARASGPRSSTACGASTRDRSSMQRTGGMSRGARFLGAL